MSAGDGRWRFSRSARAWCVRAGRGGFECEVLLMTKNVTVNWKRDDVLEGFLLRHDIEYEVCEIAISSIMTESQGRLTVRDVTDDEVLRYGIAMERGDVFPMICVVPDGKAGCYDIGQGRHRHAALLQVNSDEKATIPAILAKPRDDLERWLITVVANNLNGRPEDVLARVRHGVETLRKHPELTRKEVAAKLGITSDRLGKAVSAEKLRDKLQTAGVRRIETMTENSLLLLRPLQHNLTVLAAAANAVMDMNASQDQIKNIVSTTRSGKNEAAQLKAIDQAIEEHAGSHRQAFRDQKPIPCDTMANMLQRLEAFVAKYATIPALGLHTAKRRRTLTDQWRRIRDKIDEVLELS